MAVFKPPTGLFSRHSSCEINISLVQSVTALIVHKSETLLVAHFGFLLYSEATNIEAGIWF